MSEVNEEVKHIWISLICHLCDLETTDRRNLRNHLKSAHDIEITTPRRGKREVKNGVIIVDKKDLVQYENTIIVVEKMLGCPGCNKFFNDKSKLDGHLSSNKHCDKEVDDNTIESSTLPPRINITELLEPSKDERPAKKCKTHEEAIDTIFGARSDPLAKSVINGVVDSAQICTLSFIKKGENGTVTEGVVMTSDKEATKVLHGICNPLTQALICPKTQTHTALPSSSLPPVCDQSYLNHRLLTLPKANALLQDTFTEITKNEIEILNEDWIQGDHLRLACAQLLAGCILVDNNQILLVNCNEVYGRLRTIDPHYERFQNTYTSTLPDEHTSLYDDICFCNVDEDNSHKLIIGTCTFCSLITSSVRLDGDFKPEVGPSTFNFKPSGSTRIFLSNYSIERVARILEDQPTKLYNSDILAQLRQVRSSFTSPRTYCISRCSSRLTNNMKLRPYTIFTAADAPGGSLTSDTKLGSQIFQCFAKAVLFSHVEYVKHSELASIASTTAVKTTAVYEIYLKILSIDDGNISFSSETLEPLLTSLAQLVSTKLKDYNKQVINDIVTKMKTSGRS